MKPDVSLIPEPDRSTVVRKPLTRKQRAELILAQNGLCGCGCKGKLDQREGIIDEHLTPLGLTGTNEMENRSMWRAPCSATKTAGLDMPRIHKAKRQANETGQYARRQKNGPQIKSGGFQKPKEKYKWPTRKL